MVVRHGEVQAVLFLQVDAVGADDVHAFGARIDGVGEVARRAHGRALRRQLALQLVIQRQVGREQDAVVDVDAVSVHCRGEVAGRLELQAQAVVAGLFRFQVLRTEGACLRRVDGEGARLDGRIVAIDDLEVGGGDGVVLLRQRRRAEAARHGAAQGQGVSECIAGRTLGRGGAAEIAVALMAQGHATGQVFRRFRFQVHIDRLIVARVAACVGRTEAGKALRAAARVRRRVAGADAVLFMPRFCTDGHRQWSRKVRHGKFARRIEVQYRLLIFQRAGIEVRGAGCAQRLVDRVVQVQFELVAAVIDAGIPAPAGRLAAQAGDDGLVGQGAVLQWQKAFREDRRALRVYLGAGVLDQGRAPGGGGRRIALAIVAEGIPVHIVIDMVFAVDEDAGRLAFRVAIALVDLAVARFQRIAEIGAGAVGRVAFGHFGRDTHPAVVAQGEAGRTLDGFLLAVAFLRLAIAHFDVAAGRAFFQDDVDHAGNRVGAVLGRRTIAQYFHMVDGGQGNGVQVDGRRAAAQRTVDVDHGGRITALAVHQHQGLVGRQAAQLGRTHGVAGVGARGAGKVQRWQQARQYGSQFARTRALQVARGEDVDRRFGIDGAAVLGEGTGDHHRLQFPFGRQLLLRLHMHWQAEAGDQAGGDNGFHGKGGKLGAGGA